MGVEMRPVDMMKSQWECVLEGKETGSFAVRMGLRFVKGVGHGDFERIDRARSEFDLRMDIPSVFIDTRAARCTRTIKFAEATARSSISNVVYRTGLDMGVLLTLAESGAFDGFGLTRRQAMWEIRGAVRERHDKMQLARTLKGPEFEPLGDFETVGWDYISSGHSVRGHPLSFLRPQLKGMGLLSARALRGMKDGSRVRYGGMVICRQHPSTAGGVTFMTLEDETGFVNLVVWRDVFKKFEVIAKTAPFLGISGKIQAKEGVVHLIAEKFWVPRLNLSPQTAGSRDFH
jgi:error-prone DNA polymerase